jgi:hypothetical protein
MHPSPISIVQLLVIEISLFIWYSIYECNYSDEPQQVGNGKRATSMPGEYIEPRRDPMLLNKGMMVVALGIHATNIKTISFV